MAPRFTLPATAVAFLLMLAAAASAMPMREPVNAAPAAAPTPAQELVVIRPDGFAWFEAVVAAGITAALCCLVFAALVARHREAV